MSSGEIGKWLSVALLSTLLPAASVSPEVATFAAGCFWGVEHIFLKHYPPSQNKGILKTAVGYTGGKESSTNPGYREVCSGVTDHAEALRIEFDPNIVSYAELVGKLCYTRYLAPWLTKFQQNSSIAPTYQLLSTVRAMIAELVRQKTFLLSAD